MWIPSSLVKLGYGFINLDQESKWYIKDDFQNKELISFRREIFIVRYSELILLIMSSLLLLGYEALSCDIGILRLYCIYYFGRWGISQLSNSLLVFYLRYLSTFNLRVSIKNVDGCLNCQSYLYWLVGILIIIEELWFNYSQRLIIMFYFIKLSIISSTCTQAVCKYDLKVYDEFF